MLVRPDRLDQQAVVEPMVLRLTADNRRINSMPTGSAKHCVPKRWSSHVVVRPARSIVLRRTAAGRRAEPAIVSDGQAWQARVVTRWRVSRHFSRFGTASRRFKSAPRSPRPRTSPPICMATNSTMWRRPRMLSKSGGATSVAILAVFGSIRTPTVRTISRHFQKDPRTVRYWLAKAEESLAPWRGAQQ